MPTPVPEGAPLDPNGAYAQGPDGGLLDLSDMSPAERGVSQYSPLTPEQIREANLQGQYGTPGQAALGVGEGLLGGATADLSKVAEVRLGLTTPQAIAGREAANPYLTGAANVGGFAAGLWGADEVAGALRGADGIGSLAAQAGDAAKAAGATNTVGSAATVADRIGALQAGSAGKSLGLMAPGTLTSKMATGALTQAAYGAGQELSEEDLGGAPFSAEAVLQAAGLGAAIGATGEGLFGLAGMAIPAASRQLSSSLGRLGALSADGFKSLSGLMTGEGKAVMERLWNDKTAAVAAGGFRDLYRDNFEAFAKQAGSELADAADFARDTSKEARGALRQDFEDSLNGSDPASYLQAASREISDYEARWDAAAADHNIKQNPGVLNAYQDKIAAAKDALGQVQARVDLALNDPTTAPVWGDEAARVFKIMDDFRSDAQDGVNYKRLAAQQLTPQQLPAVQWARGIAHDAAEFTKDPEVWGDVGSRWRDFQGADARWIKATEALQEKMGVKEFGRRVLGAEKMQGMLKKIYADSDAYSGRLLDEVHASAKGLNDAVQRVYEEIPGRTYDPAKMDSLLDGVSKLRDKALDAKGMSDVVKELGGGRGGMNVGTVGFGAYLAGKLGLSAGAAAPLAAVYAASRAASRPLGAMEAFARVAGAVQKLNVAIPKGAKSAFEGLLQAGQYGSRAAAYEMAKAHLLDHQLSTTPKARADSWHEAAHGTAQQLAALTANPEQTAAQIGHAWGPLPPETRAMGIAKAMNVINVNHSKQPRQLPPTNLLGGGKPRMTSPDALRAARTFHLTTAPVPALGALLAGRGLTPEDVATATAANPETVSKWQSALMEHVAKADPKSLSLEVQGQLAIALGRPPYPIGYAGAQQTGYGPQGPTGPAAGPGNKNVPAKDTQTRKFKSDLANAERLPSTQSKA